MEIVRRFSAVSGNIRNSLENLWKLFAKCSKIFGKIDGEFRKSSKMIKDFEKVGSFCSCAINRFLSLNSPLM